MKANKIGPVVLLIALLATSPLLAQDNPCERSNLVIVLDSSSSMNGPLGDQTSSTTKYDAAKTAIESLLQTYSVEVNIGLASYPGVQGGCQTGGIVVAPGQNTSDAIKTALSENPSENGDFSPILKTLENVRQYYKGNHAGKTNYVLLISDGFESLYDECGLPHKTQEAAEAALIALVEEMAKEKIIVYVVGFGTAVNTYGLNKVALKAGTAIEGCNQNNIYPHEPNQCYYKADNAQKLVTTLKTIAIEVQKEICDGKDNDCDGKIDEELGELTCGKGVCKQTINACVDGKDQLCDPMKGSSTEICDGLDNDCNGETDEQWKDKLGTKCDSDDADKCENGVFQCNSDGSGVECVESITIEETCDGKDNDCDGVVDNFTRKCTHSCGVEGTETCTDGKWGDCEATCDKGDDADNGDNDASDNGGDSDVTTPDTPGYKYSDAVDGYVTFKGKDGGSDSGSDGCGCRIESSGGEFPLAGFLLLAAAFVVIRRRMVIS